LSEKLANPIAYHRVVTAKYVLLTEEILNLWPGGNLLYRQKPSQTLYDGPGPGKGVQAGAIDP
jgi:hypothetical protein